jgi:hypothetical protein
MGYPAAPSYGAGYPGGASFQQQPTGYPTGPVAYTTPMQPHQPGAAQVDLQDAARQAFRNFDRNRNGTIDRHEFLMVRF